MAPDEERARDLAMDKRIAEMTSQDVQQSIRLSELAATRKKHAPAGFDPASDDMTIQFAVKLAENDAEIERLTNERDFAIGVQQAIINRAEVAEEARLKCARDAIAAEAENERLRAIRDGCERMLLERKAEIERLRAALRRIADNANNKNWRKPEMISEAVAALNIPEQIAGK